MSELNFVQFVVYMNTVIQLYTEYSVLMSLNVNVSTTQFACTPFVRFCQSVTIVPKFESFLFYKWSIFVWPEPLY